MAHTRTAKLFRQQEGLKAFYMSESSFNSELADWAAATVLDHSCPGQPGSEERILYYALRAEQHLPIFHGSDITPGLRDALLPVIIGGEDAVAGAVVKETHKGMKLVENRLHVKRKRTPKEIAERQTAEYREAERERKVAARQKRRESQRESEVACG